MNSGSSCLPSVAERQDSSQDSSAAHSVGMACGQYLRFSTAIRPKLTVWDRRAYVAMRMLSMAGETSIPTSTRTIRN
jgi:hypothetical protein